MSKGLNGLKIGNLNEGKKKRGKTGRIKMMEEGDGDPSGRKNPDDDTTNTWHHHYQVSQDQKASN